jgi:hypothetical protein
MVNPDGLAINVSIDAFTLDEDLSINVVLATRDPAALSRKTSGRNCLVGRAGRRARQKKAGEHCLRTPADRYGGKALDQAKLPQFQLERSTLGSARQFFGTGFSRTDCLVRSFRTEG